MEKRAKRAIADPMVSFEPRSQTKKAWLAIEAPGLSKAFSGFYGREPGAYGLLFLFALGAEVAGAHYLAEASGFPETFTQLVPALWCIIFAVLGHLHASQDRADLCEEEILLAAGEREMAGRVRARRTPWSLFRWAMRIPILAAPVAFLYYYNTALRGFAHWDPKDWVLFICYVLAAIVHMFCTGPLWASLWFNYRRLRADYADFNKGPEAPAHAEVSYVGSVLHPLQHPLPGPWFCARCAGHWMTNRYICTTGLLTDDQIQTLVDLYLQRDDQPRAMLELRRVQHRSLLLEPHRGGEILRAPENEPEEMQRWLRPELPVQQLPQLGDGKMRSPDSVNKTPTAAVATVAHDGADPARGATR